MIWLLKTDIDGIRATYWVLPAAALGSLVLSWTLSRLCDPPPIPALLSSFPAGIIPLTLSPGAPIVLPIAPPLVATSLILGLVFSLYAAPITRTLEELDWAWSQQSASGYVGG